jgi:YbbR domain-containing protein
MRNFFTHNPWQKLFSLLLAVLIWFTVNAELSMGRGTFGAPNDAVYTIERVPVAILTPPGSAKKYKLAPSEVTVSLSGDLAVLRRLQKDKLEVYVNMMETELVNAFPRRVHVRTPASVRVAVTPEDVRVERVPDEVKH